MLKRQIVQKFGILAVALLVVGSITYFGTHTNRESHAASGGTLTVAPAAGTFRAGTSLVATVYADSGGTPIDSVQSTLKYDAAQLQFIGLSDSSFFPVVAATSTGTPGVIRVERHVSPGQSVRGRHAVVTVNFRVLGSSGSTNLTFDPGLSYMVRSSDGANILAAQDGAVYHLAEPRPTR